MNETQTPYLPLLSMTWTLALAVLSAIVVAGVCALAAWRLIPRHPDNIALIELKAEVKHLGLFVDDLADKFQTGSARAAGRKSGEARRTASPEAAAVSPKEALRQRLRQQHAGNSE